MSLHQVNYTVIGELEESSEDVMWDYMRGTDDGHKMAPMPNHSYYIWEDSGEIYVLEEIDSENENIYNLARRNGKGFKEKKGISWDEAQQLMGE